ncbi:MAG: translation initiation factor IF-3 [Phycisphaerae bacterium]
MRCNEQIRITPIRLIDQDKNMIGVVPTAEALRMARDAGLDLVEMSPNERPPVCKIMDYGKHKYLQSKKQKQKHHEQRIKEVRMRPKTDEHDRTIKMKRARAFLEHGDRVQFTMLFRGRERFRQDMGLNIFNSIVQALEDIAKVDRAARAMGKRMTMVLAPLKVSSSTQKPKQGKSSNATPPKKSVINSSPDTTAAGPGPASDTPGDGTESAPPPDSSSES